MSESSVSGFSLYSGGMQNLNRDLAQFLEQLKARGVSANTQKAYSSDINDLLVFLSDTKQSLDLEALRSWLYRISEAGGSKATLARKTSAIKSFTAWRADSGLADQDPALRLRSPKLDRPLPKVASELSLSAVFDRMLTQATQDNPVGSNEPLCRRAFVCNRHESKRASRIGFIGCRPRATATEGHR